VSAVLVLPDTADEADWLAARRKGIGASEIAAIMGRSPYDSLFSLWWRKRMGWEIPANNEMSTGTFLEPTIAGWFAKHYASPENLHIDTAGLYQHADRPWQMATPDRLVSAIDNCGGICDGGLVPDEDSTFFIEGFKPCSVCGRFKLLRLLECKWVAFSWDGWGEEGTDDVPVHYRDQALWQLDVMGLDEVDLCALGPGGFRVYRVRRDEKELVGMRERGCRFMDSLAAGTPPDVDEHSSTLPILRRLHADIEDREQEIPAQVAQGWQRAKKFSDLAKQFEAKYTALLRAHLGDAKTAVLAGEKFAARTSNDQLRRTK
jgi:putative phage-type endonuclease